MPLQTLSTKQSEVAESGITRLITDMVPTNKLHFARMDGYIGMAIN